MAYTPENNPYIPGDPYSYDLKWIVDELKKALELYTPLHDEFTDLSEEFDDLHGYVMNYFATLDINDEVAAAVEAELQRMYDTGELLDIMRPFMDQMQAQISAGLYEQDQRLDVLEDRMDEFAALPDGSTAGDAELMDIRIGAYGRTYNSAGNSVRGQILELSEQLEGATATAALNNTYAGVTMEFIDAHTIRMYGTSTAARRICCLNGQNFMAVSTTVFNKTMEAGTYNFSIARSGTHTGTVALTYTYTTFASPVNAVTTNTASQPARVTLSAPVMLGIGFASGENFGTAEAPTILTFAVTQISAVDLVARRTAAAESRILQSTNDLTDRTADIINHLNLYGYCELGEGIFYTSGIEMPEGSSLTGQGRATILRLLESVSAGAAVTMHKWNSLSNMRISGTAGSDIAPTTNGGRNGVAFVGNYDGTDDGDAYTTSRCSLDNVAIVNFSGSGIYCHNTSINVRQGLYASQFYVTNCWAGINIDYYSEFNKFVNGCMSLCRYACRNNGGNNNFVNCTFHASLTAFYIDGAQPNSGHGVIDGCTFCHTGSNSGTAISINNCSNGFVISASQIWYNSVSISASEGIVFDGCEFGRGTTGAGAVINITGGQLVMFTGCVFMNDVAYPPRISISSNGKVRFTGCYGSKSGNVIAP